MAPLIMAGGIPGFGAALGVKKAISGRAAYDPNKPVSYGNSTYEMREEARKKEEANYGKTPEQVAQEEAVDEANRALEERKARELSDEARRKKRGQKYFGGSDRSGANTNIFSQNRASTLLSTEGKAKMPSVSQLLSAGGI